MTISSTTRKAGPFVGNGVTTEFPFDFKLFATSDLRVVRADALGVETDLVHVTDCTVTLNADQDENPGGSVVLNAPLADGFRLVLLSAVPELQPVDLTNQGGFYPELVNGGLDRATVQVQQLREQMGRSITVPVTSEPGDLALPSPSPGQLLGWTDSGLTNFDPSELVSVAAYGATRVDKFTGDGTTAIFSLSASPGVQNNLRVSIGGVMQTPGDDFIWSGGVVLSFNVPPPVGTRIVAQYQQALLEFGAANADLSNVDPGVGREALGLSGALVVGEQAVTDGLDTAVNASQTGSGVVSGPYDPNYLPLGFAYNKAVIDDKIAGPTDQSYTTFGHAVMLRTDGPDVEGTRTAIYGENRLLQPTSASNANRFYAGIGGVARASSGDGGTSTSDYKGAFFGGYFAAVVDPGVQFLANATCLELNPAVQAGSSVGYKSAIQIASLPGDVVQGTGVDAAITISRNVGAVGWRDGFLFTDANGLQPFNAGSTIMRAEYSGARQTIVSGINLTGYDFSGNAFSSPGFAVNGSGDVKTNKVVSAAGQTLVLTGSSNIVAIETPETNLDIRSTTGPANAKKLRVAQRASDGSTLFYALNDAENAALPFVELKRTGGTPTQVDLFVPLRMAAYTVAALPAASAALKGAKAYVTDATAPSFLGGLTGGGAVVCPVFCNGSAWVAG